MVVFTAWLVDFNKRMKSEDRKEVLLVDNAGGHNLEPEFKASLTNLKVEYLPPNTISELQPCDAGITSAFKAKYRCKVIRHLLVVFDE